MRRVEVVPYHSAWPCIFEKEAEHITEVLSNLLVCIYHIGSTSVSGLKAKPIIDIMPVVKHIESVDTCNLQMEQLGYAAMGEYGIAGRRFFRKGESRRTCHVHVFQEDNRSDIRRHLAVRDYLRAHQETAREYGDLKEKLAVQFPKNIQAYMAGKNAFVEQLERKAIEWYGNE
ncbi:GrpB family protein [Virgibacillus halophilus]|uniref:GrpB family protein n=1 Tax=Tigheibacillus halophilus TaxID=361280 RepID=A0ABU5C9X1_9BACI|nr:GrpB family protein [Virgibacillus halophilus]